MYESFFQFQVRPFRATPQPEIYYPAGSIDAARQTLSRVIERDEGTGLLVGPPGTGKSLLLALLAEQFRTRFQVCGLAAGRLADRRALLQTLLFELGGEYRGLDENEARLELIDYLSRETSERGLLLLVDEAQGLPLALFEELRLMGNVTRGGQPRVRSVLAGTQAVEERLAHPKLAACGQRIAGRSYLRALDRTECRQFVRYQIEQAGALPETVFTEQALDRVFQATQGNPRLINQLCDHALLLAFAGGTKPIEAAGISEAWADLQQLPAPWNETESTTTASSVESVIEFGTLDDEEFERADDSDFTAAAPIRSQPADEPLSIADPVADVDQCLEALDDHLESLNDGQPPAAVRPEYEFIFRQPRAFHDEAYAEEEVVVDRFADLPAAGPLRIVDSPEGRDLADLLQRVRILPESIVGPDQAARLTGVPQQSGSRANRLPEPLPHAERPIATVAVDQGPIMLAARTVQPVWSQFPSSISAPAPPAPPASPAIAPPTTVPIEPSAVAASQPRADGRGVARPTAAGEAAPAQPGLTNPASPEPASAIPATATTTSTPRPDFRKLFQKLQQTR